jgi:hypothetical protein
MLAATLAAADVGQSVVAGLLGLGAAGVAGGVVAMAWSIHMHQIRLAGRLAMKEATAPAENAGPVPAVNGANGNGNGAGLGSGNGNGVPGYAADGDGVPRQGGYTVEPGNQQGNQQGGQPGRQSGRQQGRQPPRPDPAPQPAIEGPDSVVIGEQTRYRVRRSGTQQVVAWAAGGGSVSQAADPAYPDDLLLVADRPGNLTVSVRLREGLTERRETKAVTAVGIPEAAAPPVTLRLFLQDWPLAVVAILVVGFAAALVALGSLAAASFVALVAPLAALLGVIAVTRRSGGGGSGDATVRSGLQQPRH